MQIKITPASPEKDKTPEEAYGGTIWEVRSNNGYGVSVNHLVIKIHSKLYVSLGKDGFGSKVGHNPDWFYGWKIIRELKPGTEIIIKL